ncbi:MAG: aspartate carbamoyltransferase [Verrucomicrobia bacterium]|nr:MAG: aspartate carbamoyltransferase [Verrucomicrobiota bacterium]
MIDIHWTNKDLLGIEALSKEEIQAIFSKANVYKKSLESTSKKNCELEGKTVVNLFLEPSTRTRIAFEVAAKNLSAEVITIEDKASSLSKGESLHDTVLNIQALSADAIVMRHSCAGSAAFISKLVKIPVINAGDGAHEHPTQALLDCFTLLEYFKTKDLKGKKVTILGDILFSRVARSNIWALQKLGAEITLAGPSTLVPKTFECMGVKISHNLKNALSDADAVILLRIQHERQTSTHFPSLGEYTNMFGLNSLRASWLKPKSVIMHPGPINRGVEIDSNLADSPHSLILNQVSNGIAIRMAVLSLCVKASQKGGVN